MPHPASGYRARSGKKIPSVTTVINRFKESGGLIHWANTLALEPYLRARSLLQRVSIIAEIEGSVLSEMPVVADINDLLAIPEEAADYRHVRDKAAGVGTIVHARVDARIRHQDFQPVPYISADIPDPLAASQTGYEAFLQWAEGTRFELLEGEVQLVSEVYKYGGTPDSVLVHNRASVGDWKTGEIYQEQVLPQLAAYRQLLTENGREIGEDAHVVTFNRKTGAFTHRYFTPAEMAHGWKMFWYMRQLYQLLAELKDGITTSPAASAVVASPSPIAEVSGVSS